MEQSAQQVIEASTGLGALEMTDHIESKLASLEADNAVSSTSMTIQIAPRKIAKILLLLVAFLSVTGTVANLLIFQVVGGYEHPAARLLNRFDLGHEPSIPAFYSSFALLAAAILLGLIAYGEHSRNRIDARYWTGLSFIFVLLAIDEMVMIHEMFCTAIDQYFDLHGVFFFSWVIPGLIFAATVGLVFLRFLWRLEPAIRRWFLLAGCVFVGGAVGMEMIAGIVVENFGVESIGHTVVQTIEETCEMLGVVIFIYALLNHIEKQWGNLQLIVSDQRSHRDIVTG